MYINSLDTGIYLDCLAMDSLKQLNLMAFMMINYSCRSFYLKIVNDCKAFDVDGQDVTDTFDWTWRNGTVKMAITLYGVFCYGLGNAKLCLKVTQLKKVMGKAKDEMVTCYI